MSGGATVVFWMLFRRASSGYPHRCLLLNDAPSRATEGLRFHVKLDAVYKRHCPGGYTCAARSWMHAALGTGQALASLAAASTAPERSALASHHED